MSFAVVHMQKFGKGGLRGIQSHNQREKDPHTNPDIDKSRTEQNYTVHDTGDFVNYHKAVKNSLDISYKGDKTIRKDAVVMCSFIVTSDNDFFKGLSAEKQEQFFRDSYTFFADRYGVENIINANVHMDEKTPHMHLGVVPITADGRLSAKTLFDRKELTSIQTDFAKQVGERYGLERGLEGSPDKHLDPLRHKQKTAEQSVERATAEYDRIRSTATEIGDKGKEELARLKALQEERKALEGQIQALKADLTARQLNRQEVFNIKPERTLTGAIKGVTIGDIENLKATAIKGLESTQQLSSLSVDYQRLKEHVPTLQDKIQHGKEVSRLKELETAFQRLPESVQRQLFPTKSHIQELGRER